MANDVSISQGSGVSIATDEAGGRHYQLMKLVAGAEDDAARIGGDAVNGLDVDVTRLPAGTVAGAASLPAGTNNIGDVDIASALPAGTNNIGDVDIASIAAGDNNIGNVDIVSMPAVDTELPAAATLTSAGYANQATPQVAAQVAGLSGTTLFPVAISANNADGIGGIGLITSGFNHLFNSATWDRQRGANGVGDTATGLGVAAAGTYLFNDSTWDRQRSNFNKQLLASAARTATTNSADQANVNAKGVLLLLDVTANPGGLETLTVSIEAKLGGVYRAITAFAATASAANATYVYILYPGIVETSATGNVEVQGLVLPRDWRVKVTHSSTGSWTYALESSLLV